MTEEHNTEMDATGARCMAPRLHAAQDTVYVPPEVGERLLEAVAAS